MLVRVNSVRNANDARVFCAKSKFANDLQFVTCERWNKCIIRAKTIYIIVMTGSNYFQFIECGYDIFGWQWFNVYDIHATHAKYIQIGSYTH